MSNTPTNTPTQNQYTNSELEQIAELQHRIFTCFGNISYKDSAVVAETLYKEGWRKQSENMVEVVRCKDCVNRIEFDTNKYHCELTGYYCGKMGYCSDGVRKKMGGGEE